MATSVGGVMVEFDGDASGAAAAMKAVSEKLDELVAKEKNLKAALDAATASGNASENAIRALRSAHAEAQTAVDRLTGKLAEETAAEKAVAKATKDAEKATKDAEKAARDQASASEKAAAEAKKFADTHGHLGEKARKVDEVFGALQVSAGGVAQAFGTQASAITDVIGGGADIAKSFGMGGPILAALTAATAGVAILIDKFDLFGTKADEAAKKARKALDDLDEKAAGIRLGTAAKLADESPELLGQRRAVEKAQQGVGMAKLRAGEVGGGAFSLASLQEMAKAGAWMPAGGKEAVEKFVKASATLAAEQNNLSAMLEDSGVDEELKSQFDAINAANEAERKYQQALEESAERLLSQQYSAAIRGMDANAARQEVEAELGENDYTAEDRATREDRGVFEVPKQDFDARLAGIDPDEAQKLAEEAVAAIFDPFNTATETIVVGMTDVVTATADDIESMNADFLSAGEAALDLRDPLEQFGDSLSAGIDSLGGVAGIATTAIEGGASGVGQAVGGVAGMAIGAAVGGPAGAQVGSALGSALGGLLGDALDKLIESLGVLTPLFDAIGTIIGALQPILVVLGGLFVTIGDAIVSLAPVIIILSRLIGALLIPFVRVAQLLLVLVPIVALVASIILVWVDYLTIGIGFLDEYFFTPLVDSVLEFVNVVIMAYNGIIGLIRMLPGMGEFGTMAEYMTRDESAFTSTDDMINDVKEAAALGAAEGSAGGGTGGGEGGGGGGGGETTTEDSWGQDLANVPSGFKAMAAIYASADAESGAGMLGPQAALAMTINIENWNSKGDSQRDWDDLRRLARNGHKGKKASSSRFAGDEKN